MPAAQTPAEGTCMVALSSVRGALDLAGKAWQMSSWESGGLVLRTTEVRMSMAVCRGEVQAASGQGGTRRPTAQPARETLRPW